VDELDGHADMVHDGGVAIGPRTSYVHEAALELDAGADPQAPGAAVTVALCGHWEHEGPCRWPHHTAWETRADGRQLVRTVFVVASDEADDVRSKIDAALRGADAWTVASSGPAPLDEGEIALASRLDRTGR
jgi:hypothetical protein